MISTTTLVYLSPFTEAKIINNLPNIVYHCLTLSWGTSLKAFLKSSSSTAPDPPGTEDDFLLEASEEVGGAPDPWVLEEERLVDEEQEEMDSFWKQETHHEGFNE